MTKEEFKFILDRQQSSGLAVRDFCENEAYTLSSFNYLKSKFGFVRNYQKACVSDLLNFRGVDLEEPSLQAAVDTAKEVAEQELSQISIKKEEKHEEKADPD